MGPSEAQSYYRRGDSNEDGLVNLADVISVLNGVFGAPPPCFEAADVNTDDTVDVGDAIYLIDYIFLLGLTPGCPFSHFGRGGNQPPPCPGPGPCHPTLTNHTGFISVDEVWGPDTTHQLFECVVVEPSATLTILPGTTVLGDVGAALIVLPDAQLFAVGTELRPVVFSSARPCPEAGDWHGVYLLGNAPTNLIDPFVIEIGEIQFGGGEDDDSSGELKNVRIEYAGQNFGGPNITPGGLNLFGVGRSTLIENLLVKRVQGDGVRIEGGAASLRHIVVERCQGDAFDISAGYQGVGQYWAARLDEQLGDRGLVIENNFDDHDADPRTNLLLSNFCLVGQSANSTAMLFHRGASATVMNGLIQGFDNGVDVDDKATTQHGELFMDYCTFYDAVETFETGDDESELVFTSADLFEVGGLGGSAINLEEVTPIMIDSLGLLAVDPCAPTAPNFAEVMAAPTFDPVILDSWFQFADYRGGVDPQDDDWTQAVWISFSY